MGWPARRKARRRSDSRVLADPSALLSDLSDCFSGCPAAEQPGSSVRSRWSLPRPRARRLAWNSGQLQREAARHRSSARQSQRELPRRATIPDRHLLSERPALRSRSFLENSKGPAANLASRMKTHRPDSVRRSALGPQPRLWRSLNLPQPGLPRYCSQAEHKCSPRPAQWRLRWAAKVQLCSRLLSVEVTNLVFPPAPPSREAPTGNAPCVSPPA